jgi:predicted nucleic acid-binding protein
VIILDTNVIAEVMKPEPSLRVMKWLEMIVPSKLFTTSINEMEVLYSIQLMPQGRKRDALQKAATSIFQEKFGNRVLPFDVQSASVFALLAATRKQLGHPIKNFDCQIAAIARVHGASIATRDLQDFSNCGVELIDPWA